MVEEPREDAGKEPEESAPEEAAGPEAAPGEPGEAAGDVPEEGAAPEEPTEEAQAAEEEPAEAVEEEPAEAAEPAAPEEAAEGEAPEGAEEGAAAEPPRAERRPKRRRKQDDGEKQEVIPGAHLEPDLVLEEERRAEERFAAEYGAAAEAELAAAEQALAEETEGEVAEAAEGAETGPVARQPLDLAADARYRATGKRKAAVARVVLRPGDGTFRINERHLDEYFPRVKLQRMARQPLEVAGYAARLDVMARIQGGGTASQAGALRHGIARALVEADPNLRAELKRRGYLTRDPRVKERKKAGLKKARKRPQFSKR
jgi:small subunit ribosomal protein S9